MAKLFEKKPGDPRTKALSEIWGTAFAMLAVCIPLCAILKSPWIPIAVIFGTAIVTFYIWNSGDKGNQVEGQAEKDELRAKIKELEERLANVEVINRFEDRLAEKQVRQAAENVKITDEVVRPAVLPERS